jgi:hypothetical protein
MKDYFIREKIYPDAVPIIDEMIDRKLELLGVYRELHEKLALRHNALWVFFDLALMSAIFLNEVRSDEARRSKAELQNLNQKIAKAALDLLELLEQRNDLQEGSGFWSGAHFHIVDVIDQAAQHNASYLGWLQDPLQQLRGRFDHKYWPSLDDLVGVIADDSEEAVVEATNSQIDALTQRQRPSRTDFFRALFLLIDQNRGNEAPYLPEDFDLTDGSFAALGTCLLGLGPDDTIEAPYIKGFRRREKTHQQRRSTHCR